MEGIDWFNISSEKAEAVLPYLLSKLHDEQFITAAQFLLCQPHLIRECPNREQLLKKLDERKEQNRNAGKNVLKRLRWYQMDKKQKLGRHLKRRNRADFNQIHNRSNSFGDRSSPYDREPRRNDWRFNSDPTKYNAEDFLNRNSELAETEEIRQWCGILTEEEKHKRSIEGSQAVVNYQYRAVFEEVFSITWDLPENVVDLLILWCSSALGDDIRMKSRRLRRTPAFKKKEFSHSLVNTVKRVVGYPEKKRYNGKLVRVVKVGSDRMCSVRFTRSGAKRKIPSQCLIDIDDTYLDVTSGKIKRAPVQDPMVDMNNTFLYNTRCDSKLDPQLLAGPLQSVIRSRWPKKKQLQNAAPLEDWEREMLRFLKNKRTLNSREMNLVSKLMARDGVVVSENNGKSNVETKERDEVVVSREERRKLADGGKKKEASENDDVSGDNSETNL